MTKTRAFLEYYAKAAAGVPAGQWARDALAEMDGLEAAAEARGFERARTEAERIASAYEPSGALSVAHRVGAAIGATELWQLIRAMQDGQRGG